MEEKRKLVVRARVFYVLMVVFHQIIIISGTVSGIVSLGAFFVHQVIFVAVSLEAVKAFFPLRHSKARRRI